MPTGPSRRLAGHGPGFVNGTARRFRPCGFNSARQRVDGAACAVNHNFPICRGVLPFASLRTMLPRSHVPAADDFATIRKRQLKHVLSLSR